MRTKQLGPAHGTNQEQPHRGGAFDQECRGTPDTVPDKVERALNFRGIRGLDRPLRRRLMAISGVDYECRQVPFLLGRAAFWLLWLPLAFLLPWGVFQMMLWVIKWVAAGFRS